MAASSKAGSHSVLGNSKCDHAVQSLQATLNGKYAAAERLMSLKHPDEAKLNALLGEIDVLNDNLILALESERPENYTELIGRAQCNKEEFDTHRNSWLSSRESSFTVASNVHSRSSKPSTISCGSSRSSVRRRSAEAKLASAELAIKQLREREQEQQELLELQIMQEEREAREQQERKEREAREQQEKIEREAREQQDKMKRQAQERRERQEIKARHAKREAQRMLEAAKIEAEVWNEPEHFFSTGNAIVSSSSVNKDSLVFTGSAHFSGINSSLSPQQAASTDAFNTHQALQLKQVYAQAPHYSNLTITPSLPPDQPAVQPPTSLSVSLSVPNDIIYSSLVQAHTAPVVSSASEPSTFSVFSGSIPCSGTATRTLNQNAPAFLPGWSLPAATISNPQQQNCQFQNPLVSSQNSMGNTGLVSGVSSNFLHRAAASSYLPVIDPPSVSYRPPAVSTYPQHSIYYDHHFLPRPEIPKFNGDPLQYRNFKMNFETHIESKFKDPKILLCLLLQHFEPKLRNRFQHFTDKGDAGYLMALERLEMEYGQPCIIVDAYEQRLKQTDAVKSNDPDSLKGFSELLEKTLIVLEDIQFYGSINSLDTMTYLVNKLPFDMRKSWVKEATTFQNRNKRIADFTQFVQFVARESQAANSLYGRRVLGSQFKKGPTTSFKAKKTLESSFTCTTTTAQPDKHYQSDRQASKCYFCNSDDHLLLQCPKFNKTPVEERSKFVKSRRLCYKCLSARHRTYQCRRRAPCTIKDCKGTYHHTLLHIFKETKSQSSAREAPVVSTFAATNSTLETKTHNETRSVYLCIVPVRVRYGNEELHAYAFLDQGSTHTFCDKAFAEKLQVSKQPEQLHMQTLTGTQQLEGFTCALKILPLDSDEEYSLTSVFVLDDIPIRPNLVPAKGKLQEMPHLKDIEFPQIKADKVTLLIGADIPELFLSTDYRKGRRGQPTAIKTPLGWSLLGPSLTASLATNCFLGFVNSQDEVLHKQICSLWETDFQPETSLQMPMSREDRITLELFKSSVVQVAGHYQLPLPWKPNVEQLPNSLSLSQRRLVSLKKRLLKDAELFSKYSNTIDSYIERVTPDAFL